MAGTKNISMEGYQWGAFCSNNSRFCCFYSDSLPCFQGKTKNFHISDIQE